MKSITVIITKNFGKNITLELPNGGKHVITYSGNVYLYHDLQSLLDQKEQLRSTLILPDDYEFGDEDENTEI